MTKTTYWIILSGLAALFILFFLGSFPLAIYFSLLFFLLSFVFAKVLFVNEERSHLTILTVTEGASKYIDKIPYILGVIGSLFIIFVPTPITIANNSTFVTFSSLSFAPFLKILFGLFFLSIFPGYVLCQRFFPNSYSALEKIGLVLALSYCLNSALGLILSSFNLLSPTSYILSVWLFSAVTIGSGKILGTNRVDTPPFRLVLSWKSSLLLLTGLTLLIGSYGLVMSGGPIYGLFGGDIARYMVYTNQYFQLGIATYIPWLSSFMVTGNILTGLPLIYVYSVIQYLVLLIPFSIYFFIKTLFPKQGKAASIGAFMVSVLYGMSSLPFIAKLVGTPTVLTGYLHGAVQSTLQSFIKIFWANTQSYILWNRTIEYGLAFLSLAFLFKYLNVKENKGNAISLFFGILLLDAAIFTHSAFLAIPILGTVAIFVLFQKDSRKRALNIILVFALSFLAFTLVTNSTLVIQIVSLFIYSYFSVGNSQSILNLAVILSVLFPLYTVLLFREKLNVNFTIKKFRIPKLERLKLPTQLQRWTIVLLFIFLAFLLCYFNYDSLNTLTMASASNPWYVWVLYFGLQIPLIFVYLPKVLKTCNHKSIIFFSSFTLSLSCAALLSYLGLVVYISDIGAMYLFFMAYPLSCLAAIALSVSFSAKKISVLETKNKLPFQTRSSRHKRKILIYVISTFLVISIAASFLSYTYSISISYPQDLNNPTLTSSETTILQAMGNSLPKDAVVIALSQKSNEMLSSILPNKILPIYLNIADGPQGGTWARNAVLQSYLPEAVLSSLYQLGATDVFVGSSDISLLSKSNTTFASLLNDFPLKYSSSNAKDYQIPYVLYNDSNYHVVSGLFDYPMQELAYVEVDPTPTVIYSGNQGNFWRVVGLDEGKGSIGIPILSYDTSKITEATGSMKIEVPSGNYARWQITHVYTSPQNWSAYDYIAFYWYGANTGKTLSLEIQSALNSYNYQRYDFIENWGGWKLVTIPLQNPDAASDVKPNLAQINQVNIGFWISNNVAGTFWLNNVTIGLGQWVERESPLPSGQLLTEMLLRGSQPYSIISDNNLALSSGDVYFFPYNPYVSKNVLNNLVSFIANGANVVFTNPDFASSNSIHSEYSIPNILKYTLVPNKTIKETSELTIGNQVVNCSSPLHYVLNFENKTSVKVIAKFNLSDGSNAPYILKENIGNGSITFIDFSAITNLPTALKLNILDLTWASLLDLLPTSRSVNISQQLFIPPQIFNSITFSGSMYDLWSNADLRGNLMFNSAITIKGDFSISSNYMVIEYDNLYIKSLQIIQPEYSQIIPEGMLYDVKISGSGQASFNSSTVELPNFPTSLYSKANVINKSNSSYLEVNNATITFKTAATSELKTYTGTIIVNAFSSSNSIIFRAQQPLIVLKGFVVGNVQGALIYNKEYFYAHAQQSSLKGNFSLQIMYSSGITFTQIRDVHDFVYGTY